MTSITSFKQTLLNIINAYNIKDIFFQIIGYTKEMLKSFIALSKDFET